MTGAQPDKGVAVARTVAIVVAAILCVGSFAGVPRHRGLLAQSPDHGLGRNQAFVKQALEDRLAAKNIPDGNLLGGPLPDRDTRGDASGGDETRPGHPNVRT